MKVLQEDYNIKKLISYVSEIYNSTLIDDYYGVSLSLKVLNHIENIIVLEKIKDKDYILALKYSAILHNIDNKLFFKKNNSNTIIEEIFGINSVVGNYIKEILELIHNIKKNVNHTKEWMLLPRYVHMLENIGECGLVRLYFYYCFYNKPLFSKNMNIETLQFYKLKELNNVYENKNMCMYEYFINLFSYSDYLKNSGIPYIINISRDRIEFMEKYFMEIKEKKYIDIEEILKIKKKLQKKKLL